MSTSGSAPSKRGAVVASAHFFAFSADLAFLDGIPAARFSDLYALINIDRFLVAAGARVVTLSRAQSCFPPRDGVEVAPGAPALASAAGLGRFNTASFPASTFVSGLTASESASFIALFCFLPFAITTVELPTPRGAPRSSSPGAPAAMPASASSLSQNLSTNARHASLEKKQIPRPTHQPCQPVDAFRPRKRTRPPPCRE